LKKLVLKHLFLIFLLFGGALMAQSPPYTTIDYDSSGAIFTNPERGFSAYRSAPITPSFCQQLRNQNVSVIQRIYTIPQFVNDTLSASFLNQVQNDFQVARDGGVKLVLRFSYTNNITGDDAPLDTILHHIAQLEPLLQQNYDVITYIEAGFIGAWGEWYYSTNGLNNTNDRRTVLYRLLDALPVDRMVVVRTPEYKRAIYNHYDPLTPEEAFTGTKRARTGAHNDCFLASWSDYGTYIDTLMDKTFLNLDNRYVPQGGETCNPSSYSGCANALRDLRRMRWSVINKDYHPAVLQGWVNNGCMDEIKRRLGYRFRLLQSAVQDSVRPEGAFNLSFSIVNDGWASPYNPRNLEIILRNSQGSQMYYLLAEDDPRRWMAGDTTMVMIEAGIPGDMPLGTYEVLLHFADPISVLRDRPEFAIRLANENVWEDSTGFNTLLQNVVVDTSASGNIYSGNQYFQLYSVSTAIMPNPQPFIVDDFELKGNYPNPFNGGTMIEFELHRKGIVQIDVFDIQGRHVQSIYENYLLPGGYEIFWRPQNVSSGIYIYRVRLNDYSQYKKLHYVK
jgi:hypothetical protein